MPHHWRSDHQTDPSGRPGTLGTAVARLSRLLPGCADAGSDRAHLGGAVRPGLGGARTRCRIGGSAGRAGASGPPSHYLVHAPVLLPGGPLRRQAVARRRRCTPAHRGRLRIRRWVRPRQRFLAHPGVQRPGTLPIRHPRSSDIVRPVPALSLPEDSARYCRRRWLPWADPLRHAEAEIAVFAGFPEVDRSTPQPESQRQSRRTSPTKINKEVISKQVRNGRSEV